MRDLLCACAALCALLAPSVSVAQPRAPLAAHSPLRRPPRLTRADRAELRRSLGMLLQGPSAPALPAMRSFVLPSSAPTAAPDPSSTRARTEAAWRVVERSGLVRRCWQQHLLRHPDDPGRRGNLSVRVAPDGSFSSVALDVEGAPALTSCVSLGGHSLRPIAAGEALDTSAPITLDRGSR